MEFNGTDNNEVIPLSVPSFIGNELEYVTNAINEGWVSTAGPYVDMFEKEIAGYVGAAGAVACQNGTSGLHTALLVNGVKPGQEVIVPSLTFIAAVNPVRYAGAEPVFMDCDSSLCMDPVKLERFCSEECRLDNGCLVHLETGKIIRCLVVVHVFGNMADMESIMGIAGEYHLKVIEDATEALGTYYTSGRYKGKHAGTIGDTGVYSFNGNKIITTGGGGMLVSSDSGILGHARHLTTQAKSDTLYYTHDEVGYNYRMTNLQAALGLAQLENLEQFVRVKTDNFNYYMKRVSCIEGLELMDVRQGIRSNHWFYALYCSSKYGRTRDGLISHLKSRGIQARPVWGLVHKQKPYQGCRAYMVEEAEGYWGNVVNIPCSTGLTLQQACRVADCLVC